MPAPTSYWSVTRAPRYSLVFALPLLVLYETLAFALTHDAIAGVRNGADVILKGAFLALGGGRYGLAAFGAVLFGTAGTLIWRDLRQHRGGLQRSVFARMLAESVVYALLLGGVASTLTGLLLRRLALGGTDGMDLPTQLMISLGAGLYEELLFRVLVVGALAALARRGFGWAPWASGLFATLLGALVFSAFHYIGPYGDTLELGSFTFRAIAGVLFSGLYLLRGFGIAAWSHALYDVFLALAG